MGARVRGRVLTFGGAVLLLAGAPLNAVEASATAVEASAAAAGAYICADPTPPEYYAFEMVTTRNVPGTARLQGQAEVTFVRGSPFGVSVSADGSYAYDVRLALDHLPRAPEGRAWAVWLTKSDLSEVTYAGILNPDTEFMGRVSWNKFLAIVTLEDADALAIEGGPRRWQGPVVTRGMSRSGMMHTMAGHGPFQQENCAAFGYGR
jgi:hypothetical protein